MNLGPVEILVVKFPGNQFTGEIAPALRDLVDAGTIRIIDLVFVSKDADGSIGAFEIQDLGEDEQASYNAVTDFEAPMMTTDDIERLGATLEENSSAAIMLFENVWATKFRDAMVNAGGELVLNERIPRTVIEEVAAAASAA
ncbi:MAG TPA: DUF6325 family protein [Candidatus Limnocylindria bacterium]|nr:DUF6325 family protein [Candidatus Limnocylindria bacterium]